MSLVACQECHKEISREAAACPHCGAPLSHPRSSIAVTLVQLAILALALVVTVPLAQREYVDWTIRSDAAAATAAATAASDLAAAADKVKRRAKKTSRPTLDCGSEEVRRGVTQAWRDEVARALSSKPGDPVESARPSAAQMKLDLSAFQTLDEDRAAGVMQCAAVMTVSEGAGFQPSDSQVTYRVELANQGRTLAVTLVYARIPPV